MSKRARDNKPHLLTSTQEAMVLRSLSTREGGHYIQQIVITLPNDFRKEDMQKSWDNGAARHEALRSYYNWQDNNVLIQFFSQPINSPIHILSLSGLTKKQRDSELKQYLKKDRRTGFNLFSPPLWHFTVLNWRSGEHIGIWSFHHALLDGRSHHQVLEEVILQYESLKDSNFIEPPLLPLFSSFLDWQAKQPTLSTQKHWKKKFDGFLSASFLPSLAIDPYSMKDGSFHDMKEVTFTETETQNLKNTAERHGVTLNNLIQASLSLALSRYNNRQDVTFGVTRAGRYWDDKNSTNTVGMFIHTIPFRVNTHPIQNLRDWLKILRKQQMEVRGHEFVSVSQIRQWTKIPSEIPLWNIILVYENKGFDEWSLKPEYTAQTHEKTDQTTLAAYVGHQLTLTLEFSLNVHTSDQIRIVLNQLRALLLSIMEATPDCLLENLTMQSSSEHEKTLSFACGKKSPLHKNLLLQQLEEQALKVSGAIAVKFGEIQLSYKTLHSHANQLARHLLTFVNKNDRVCVFLDRSPEQIIVWLALLKAGIAYAPVDVASPKERLIFQLQDLDPTAILTQESLQNFIPKGYKVICVDTAREQAITASLSDKHLDTVINGNSPACFLSTSGSTGYPKYSMLSFDNLNFLVRTFNSAFDIDQRDNVLQLSDNIFDFALGETILALSSGATLVMGKWSEIKPGPALCQFIKEQHINVLCSTPSALRVTPLPLAADLKLILCGGEPLTNDLVADWRRIAPLINVYGPSECAFWVTYDKCDFGNGYQTVGKPVENGCIYVLNSNLSPQPIGVPGEIYIGGAGVGLGYWNRPEKTNQHFLPDPFSNNVNARMYRSGDLARWLDDGRLEILRRIDYQIKFKGIRLELNEIETVLERHPQISQAVVMKHKDTLIAWLLTNELMSSITELETWLVPYLPLMLIPAEFYFLSDYPKTGSGKIDRPKLLSKMKETINAKIPKPSFGATIPFLFEESVVDLFLNQAKKRTHSYAIKTETHQITYGELELNSKQVSKELLQHDLKVENLVFIFLPASIEFISALIGTLIAGGTYVPIDPEIPNSRLNLLLKNSGCRFVVTDIEGMNRIDLLQVKVIDINEILAKNTVDFSCLRPIKISSENRAYVIYTSGSMGEPKGVEIEHCSLTNLVNHYKNLLKLKPGDRATMLANISFDASMADIWPTLCTGGELLIPPMGYIKKPAILINWITSEKITWTFIPTGLVEILFDQTWPMKLSLRYLLTGGDRLLTRPPPGFPVVVLNTYGPTENTVDSTWSEVAQQSDDLSLPPIGRPISNVNTYILNDNLKPVNKGEEGQLYLGGEQIARGYLGMPELTAMYFTPDPFVNKIGARMYRTGDCVRWLDNEELEFIGRQDEQVQIRGKRVELGEMEATLTRHPIVKYACCLPKKRNMRVENITAHIVLRDIIDDQVSTLQLYLQSQLPSYMVPTIFEFHDYLPLTPSGKIDRKTLDKSSDNDEKNMQNSQVLHGLELHLFNLWHELLPAAKNAPSDATFSSLGGDSLTAIRLQVGIETITKKQIELSTLLLQSTFPRLYLAVKKRLNKNEFQSIVVLQKMGDRPPLFCLYGSFGDVDLYLNLVDALGSDQPVYGIRSPALDDISKTPDSIEAAANEALALIRQVQPEGAPAILGFSWAGILAFEIARQLSKKQEEPGFTGLIGTSCPLELNSLYLQSVHFIKSSIQWGWNLILNRQLRLKYLPQWQEVSAEIKQSQKKNNMPKWARTQLSQELITIARKYNPDKDTEIKLDLFREQESIHPYPHPLRTWDKRFLPDGGWEYWASYPPQVHRIIGSHNSILKPPYVSGLASAIRNSMNNQI